MLRMNGKLLGQILWTFLKIGPVTFGGGYAMIPLIEREVVQHRGWIEERELHDIITTAGSIPGAIAINAATAIGYRMAGAVGAVVATIGVSLPTFIIALVLGISFFHIHHHSLVEAAFTSIRAAIVALIAYAAYKFSRSAIVDKTTLVLILLSVLMLLVMKVHPLVIIIGGGILGILLVYVRGRLGFDTKLGAAEKEQEKEPDWFMGDGI